MEKNRTRLSKGILQMKFMQRSSHVKELEDEEADQIQQIDDDHWVLDIPNLTQRESQYVIDQSHINIEELHFGRMSFKGFNPEIEKLMRQQNTDQELLHAEARERELGVDDEEMAHRYTDLVGTIGKKFVNKRHIVSEDEDDMEEPVAKVVKKRVKKDKKRTFMKPDDDC